MNAFIYANYLGVEITSDNICGNIQNICDTYENICWLNKDRKQSNKNNEIEMKYGKHK